MKDRPFALVGVHVGGSDAKKTREVMEKEQLGWRTFVDAGAAGAGPIATRWNLAATPTFYLLDHTGVIRYKWAGPPGEKALEEAVERLVKAAEGGAKECKPEVRQNTWTPPACRAVAWP
jgi:hypothetical protein